MPSGLEPLEGYVAALDWIVLIAAALALGLLLYTLRASMADRSDPIPLTEFPPPPLF